MSKTPTRRAPAVATRSSPRLIQRGTPDTERTSPRIIHTYTRRKPQTPPPAEILPFYQFLRTSPTVFLQSKKYFLQLANHCRHLSSTRSTIILENSGNLYPTTMSKCSQLRQRHFKRLLTRFVNIQIFHVLQPLTTYSC